MTGVPFNRRQQQSEREKMTPERIVEIARRNGEFSVSWRWRDEWLVKRCSKLVKDGLLRRRRGKPGRYYFVPVQTTEPRQAALSSPPSTGGGKSA